MAYRPSTRKRNRWVVLLLDVQPTDRVLEIGFGPGIAIQELPPPATSGERELRIYLDAPQKEV